MFQGGYWGLKCRLNKPGMLSLRLSVSSFAVLTAFELLEAGCACGNSDCPDRSSGVWHPRHEFLVFRTPFWNCFWVVCFGELTSPLPCQGLRSRSGTNKPWTHKQQMPATKALHVTWEFAIIVPKAPSM